MDIFQYLQYILLIFIILFIIIIFKNNKLEKNIINLKNEINEIKNIHKIGNLMSNESMDDQVLENFMNLVRGGAINVSSLNITGDLNVSGNTNIGGNTNINGSANINGNENINGHLTVKNGSNFSGGRHYFQDEENAGRLRVGGAWNIPGIYAEDGKDIIIGNNGIQNLYMHGGETHINNNGGHFIFKDNRLQYPAGNYELNFGGNGDGWIRLLNMNTGDIGGGYGVGGFAGRNIYTHGSAIHSPGELHINGSRLLHNSSIVRIRHPMRNAFFDNGDGWSNRNVGSNPYMNYELQVA